MGNLSIGVAGRSYYDLARAGQVFCARAIVTAPVIFSTAAGTGGPLLWNNTAAGSDKAVDAVILGVTCAVTTVSTVAGALGITGGSGQSSAPTSTTAIDTVANLSIGGPSARCNTYRIGTPGAAGGFFLPLAQLSTGALTVENEELGFIDVGGLVVVPPGSWMSLAGSATLTTLVAQLGLVWAEIPR